MIRRIQYTPFSSQLAFHELPQRFKGFSGPVGSGKSLALCHEAIKLAYVNAGRQGMITAPTYRMLHTVTRAALIEILVVSGIPWTQNKSEDYLTLQEPNSVIFFRSAEDPISLIGSNLAWFGCDELSYTAEDAWRRLEARLRDPKGTHLCGFGAWTPNGLNWTWQRFFSVSDKIDGYEAVRANPFENFAVLSKTPDYYERLRKSYDPKFFRQEVLGEYLSLFGGTVYHSFDEANVRAVKFDPAKPLCWSLDFNINPMCSVLCQIQRDPRGHAYALNVLQEIVIPNARTHELVEQFIGVTHPYIEKMRGRVLDVHVYGDPAGNAGHTSSVETDYEIIFSRMKRQTGYHAVNYVDSSAPLVKDRVNAVNGLLCNASNDRHLWVDPQCRELKADFQQVIWNTDRHGNVQMVLDKRNPKRTHISDALGYLVWSEFNLGLEGGLQRGLAW